MICKNCGKEVPDNRATCPYCLRPMQKGYLTPTTHYKTESFFERVSSPQLKWFRIIKYIPIIVSILIIIGSFILGIVDPATIEVEIGEQTKYGIMQLSSGFLCWLLWMIIGILSSIVSFVLLKICLSPVIIQTECLIDLDNYTEK